MLDSDQPSSRVLLAACDLAVVRALELIGKRIVRNGGSNYAAMRSSGKSWHQAHAVWSPTPTQLDAALKSAWDYIPELVEQHGCCGMDARTLQEALDDYVRTLCAIRAEHSFERLQDSLRIDQ